MEPELSLNYSSGAGNGLLGIGWTLTGPSAITRCPMNSLQDGARAAVTFSADDRYCLDGQRLLIVNLAGQPANASLYGDDGTTYRTERDAFARITVVGRYNGQGNMPQSFRVENKAGLILEFGISANSRIMTKFAPNTVPDVINRWMLQRVSDRHGNYVEFVYCAGEVATDGSTCDTSRWSGSAVIHYIRYTNRGATPNGTSAVVFGYETRPDRSIHYHYGSSYRQTQRLRRIETYTGFAGSGTADRGVMLRRYTLNYEPWEKRATHASRLVSIQESNGNQTPGDADKLPALEMTYPVDAVFGMTLPSPSNPSTETTMPVRCGGTSGQLCQ